MNPTPTDRELAAILTGLRMLQQQTCPAHLEDIATDEGRFPPLTAAEIDALCERLNVIVTAPEPRIVVTIAGGLVSEVHADAPVSLAVLDHDVEGVDEDRIREILETDGSRVEATIGHWEAAEIPCNPEWVGAIFATLDAQAEA